MAWVNVDVDLHLHQAEFPLSQSSHVESQKSSDARYYLLHIFFYIHSCTAAVEDMMILL